MHHHAAKNVPKRIPAQPLSTNSVRVAPWEKPKTSALPTEDVATAGPGRATAQATDQLVARALHLAFGPSFQGVPELTPARVRLLSATVLSTPAHRSSVIVAQHFNARLVTYGRYLLPRDRWHITAADYTAGKVLWHHHDPRLPDVLDVLATGARRGIASADLRHPSPDRVTRTCNLANPRDSVLQFPGEARTYPWATIDDPLRYGLEALTACDPVGAFA